MFSLHKTYHFLFVIVLIPSLISTRSLESLWHVTQRLMWRLTSVTINTTLPRQEEDGTLRLLHAPQILVVLLHLVEIKMSAFHISNHLELHVQLLHRHCVELHQTIQSTTVHGMYYQQRKKLFNLIVVKT
jgi:hypothetical protein